MKEKIASIIDIWYKEWFRNEQLYNGWARQHGLNYNELFTLHVLHKTGGCTPSYIAQFLSIPKQTVNSLLGRLEKRGVIERLPLEEDKRSCLVRLTEEGGCWADEMLTELKKIEYRVFSSFTREELEAMIDVNSRLTERFSQEMGGEDSL